MIRPEPPPISSTRYTRSPQTSWRRIGDETVVLDQNGHRLFGLNDAGSDLWHRLDARRTVRELVEASSVSEVQVMAFLAQLADLGLVEQVLGPVLVEEAQTSAAEVRSAALPANISPPAITWQEALQNAAQTAGGCAFLSGQNPLCNSAPFS